MSEFVYKDYLPANARVIVDYKKEQKVAFSYPIKWSYRKAVWARAYPVVTSWWVGIHIIPLMYACLLLFPIAILYLLIKSIFYPYSRTITTTTTSTFNFVTSFLPIIIVAFYVFGVPAIITLILSKDKERISKWIPKMGYWTANYITGSKEITFKSKDIIKNKIIIPSFGNIFLNYKCKGEFNKYLEKVEVMEIPFNYKHRRFLLPFLKKKEKNDYDFRAVFYFLNKPKNGNMCVEFI